MMHAYFIIWMVVLLFMPLAFSKPAKKNFVTVPELTCPEEIMPQADQILPKAPAGWRKFVDKANFRPLLERVTFYTNAPEALASLQPDDHGIVYLSNTPEGNWISCQYSQTPVQLTRKIPSQFTECRPIYPPKAAVERNPLIGYLDHVECR